ncbi:MAG TPA: hypothetical protein VH277_11245 [Gemmatimonadaceae bacterium]|nr:hypothetical protein [Gemmatimonadaceae bacterium]
MIARDMRALTRAPAARIALFAVIASSAALIWAVADAVRAPKLPEVPPTISVSLSGGGRTVSRPRADIAAAVDNDLFAEDRSAPDTPYRMPDDPASDDKPAAVPMKPFVLGTAVGSDGRNFATLQMSDGPPRLVVVGDRIGDWVVKDITRGKIVLVSTGGLRAELTVVKPGT